MENPYKPERNYKMIKIMNISNYAYSYKYIVARYVDGDWWFYGAWNEADRAYHAAMVEGGQVFMIEDIEQ